MALHKEIAKGNEKVRVLTRTMGDLLKNNLNCKKIQDTIAGGFELWAWRYLQKGQCDRSHTAL